MSTSLLQYMNNPIKVSKQLTLEDKELKDQRVINRLALMNINKFIKKEKRLFSCIHITMHDIIFIK